MKIIRQALAAFSLYSRIPVTFVKDADLERAIAYIPLVGAFIGGIECALWVGASYVNLPAFAGSIILALVPVVVTGGFHIDGFCDTKDALASYAPRERKLEILKDPHIGSFAAISLVSAVLLLIAGIYVIYDDRACIIIMSLIFVISRALTALTSLFIRKAKDDGMLAHETARSGAGTVIPPVIFLILAFAGVAYVNIWYLLAVFAAFLIAVILYRHMALKQFGGVTGDTAGYFLVVSEVFATDVLAFAHLILKS